MITLGYCLILFWAEQARIKRKGLNFYKEISPVCLSKIQKLYRTAIIPFLRNLYTFLSKPIYLSLKTYIPFSQNLYTFSPKPIYLFFETYIPFSRNLYTFSPKTIYLFSENYLAISRKRLLLSDFD